MVDVAGELMLTIPKIEEFVSSGDWTQVTIQGSEDYIHSKTYITRLGIMLEVSFANNKVTHVRTINFIQAG